MSEKKNMVQLPDVGGGLSESTDKVERIREIVFGAHMREYTQKFDLANREMARLNREIERLNQQLRDQEALFKRQLRDEVERLALQIQEMDKRQTHQLQELDKQQTQEVEALEQKQSQRMQELDQIMHRSDRDLLNKLRELSEQLNHMKVDRSTLGELLMELGAGLKSNAPAALASEIDVLDELGMELA
jgi:phage-related minor tail protein